MEWKTDMHSWRATGREEGLSLFTFLNHMKQSWPICGETYVHSSECITGKLLSLPMLVCIWAIQLHWYASRTYIAITDSVPLRWEAMLKGTAVLLGSGAFARGVFARGPTRVLFILDLCSSMPGLSLFLTTISWLMKDKTFCVMTSQKKRIYTPCTASHTHMSSPHVILQEQELRGWELLLTDECFCLNSTVSE